jgi:hypothetical protein
MDLSGPFATFTEERQNGLEQIDCGTLAIRWAYTETGPAAVGLGAAARE